MVEDRWVYAARRLTSVEFSFDPCDIYRDSPRGVPRGGQNVQKKCAKIANFGFYGLNYGKTVEDRWVHAARRLTSIEFSFDSCNIYCDGSRGVGYPADARSVCDSYPSCYFLFLLDFEFKFKFLVS